MYYYEERYRTKYHSARKDKIKYIVIHYTGTAAGALANARAIERNLKKPRSTHYFVEGERVLHVVPDGRAAWHVGELNASKKIPVCNQNAIGVDLCEDKLVYDKAHRSAGDTDWYFDEETEATAAELVAGLMRAYLVPIEHVVRHFDVTGKDCPRPFVGDDINIVYGESGNARWAAFRALVSEFYEGAHR